MQGHASDPFAAAAATTRSEAVRNDKVVVTDHLLGQRQQLKIDGGRPSVTVFFTDATLQTTLPDGKTVGSEVKRGAAVFDGGTDGIVQNATSAEIRFVRIEFVGNGLNETWGTTGLASYKVTLENQYARVYEIRITAGTNEPLHTHHNRVVVCLSGAKMMHLLPDGRKEPSSLKTGEFGWRLGQTHVGQNLDTTDLWVIAVEPK